MKEIQAMIDLADKDGDGKVSEKEFIAVMSKTNMFRDHEDP